MTFGAWLVANAGEGGSNERLRKFASDRGSEWPYGSGAPVDYLKVIATHAEPTERKELLDIAGKALERWEEDRALAGAKSKWSVLSGPALLAGFGFIIAAILAWGIFQGRLLADIAKPELARGLITFLFAFSTIAIFILVAIATFWMDKDEVKERFASAKDLITILIGVLGTILGFYFGAADDPYTRSTLLTANVTTTSPQVRAGDKTSVTGIVLGGVGPYDLNVAFTSAMGGGGLNPIDVKGFAGGRFAHEVAIASEFQPSLVGYRVTVRDANGTLTSADGAISVVAR
ncbi:hypothetical protein [Ensifer adhaerens]|uniref:hypothetical protein n=1 Tax=Ensifer adhaerens TaxID=106592 RepID=UPI000DC37D05|nr:hypothetical protein [Ensifer adhaerens]RAR99346.1 hypothetical protein DEU52_1494 [Ensifer adhaerens]